MFTMNFYDFGELWTRFVEQPDSQTLLAAAAIGLAVAWRILRRQHRAQTERRLQAAAAAYAARELAQEQQISATGLAV
jgi:hypothetical protein